MSSRHILETPASEKEFQENLHELDHKLNFVIEQEFREIAAVVDVQKDVIKLKMKVENYFDQKFLLYSLLEVVIVCTFRLLVRQESF